MLSADALRPRSHLAALGEGTYVSGRRYSGGGGATGWHALAPGSTSCPDRNQGVPLAGTHWPRDSTNCQDRNQGRRRHRLACIGPGFHQLPAPQSGGWAEATPDDTAAT